MTVSPSDTSGEMTQTINRRHSHVGHGGFLGVLNGYYD
jgi:hypothetical protein